MRLLLSLGAAALLLAGCGGGLPSHGQFMGTGTSIGLSAGTDPSSGGVSANIGYKSGTLAYNPNAATSGEDGEGEKTLITSFYGNASDSRSMMNWTDAEISAGTGDGVGISLGDGVAFGPSAALVGCGVASASGGTSSDCVDLFNAPQ